MVKDLIDEAPWNGHRPLGSVSLERRENKALTGHLVAPTLGNKTRIGPFELDVSSSKTEAFALAEATKRRDEYEGMEARLDRCQSTAVKR